MDSRNNNMDTESNLKTSAIKITLRNQSVDTGNTQDIIKSSDNVSNVSTTSSMRHARLQESAERAAAELELSYNQEKEEAELQQIMARLKIARINHEKELEKAKAKEKIFHDESEASSLRPPPGGLKTLEPRITSKFPSFTPSLTSVKKTLSFDDDENMHTLRRTVPSLDSHYSRRRGTPAKSSLEHMPITTTVSSSHGTEMSRTLLLQKQMLDILRLPKSTLPKFSGNPKEFNQFMISFKCDVGNSSVDNAQKLCRLAEACTGRAKEVLAPALIMDPDDGYPYAMDILYDRFGDDFLIAKAWIDSVSEGGVIPKTDAIGLQHFADQLTGCYQVLKAMGRVGEIENGEKIGFLAERLPFKDKDNWNRSAYKYRKEFKEYPRFKQFVEYVESLAGAANDPLYGCGKNQPSQ